MNRSLYNFLKYEVDNFDIDSNYIYLELDKDRFDFPVMPIYKNEIKLWALLTFTPCGDELEDLRVELEKNSKELEVLRKAYKSMAKDYCENMGCSFCKHHTKCLEANHFEDLEGKDFLQEKFINEVNNDT